MRVRPSRLIIALGLAALSTGLARSALAQDVSTVFVHGIFAASETWDFLKSNLHGRLRIHPVAKSTTFYQTEAHQSGQLEALLNADGATPQGSQLPFVAHSNGGLVSRRLSIDDPRVRKLVTVATPHRGSYLANNWLDYNVLNYGHWASAMLLNPLDFYANNDPAVPGWLGDAVSAFNNTWNSLFWNLDALMCPVAGMCIVFDGLNSFVAPLSYDVRYNSPFFTQTLNSTANLNREASAVQQRVGLYTSISAENGLFHLAFPSSYNNWGIARQATILTYLLLFDHYGEHSDPWLYVNRGRWLDGAMVLVDLDAEWYNLIGSLDLYYRYTNTSTGYYETYLEIWANDGLIDHRSAGYPGGTLIQRIFGDLSHTQQTSSSATADHLYLVLRDVFNIPDRPPPGGGPTWSVTIYGPSSARPGDACYWYASSNVANASYEWKVDGNAVGWAQELWYTAYSSFTLEVQVWNSEGAGGSDSRSVSIDWANSQCYVE